MVPWKLKSDGKTDRKPQSRSGRSESARGLKNPPYLVDVFERRTPMISLRQPALVLHSSDVPSYKYQMTTTWNQRLNLEGANSPL
jgi:hypothetical protein